MIDTPYVNDGADESLRKTVSLLNKIEAKTGATTITGPVTVSNEVEVTNSSGSPIPVSGTVTANTGLTQPLTNTELRLTAVPVSLASVPSHAVTGPLTDTQLRAAVVPVSLASVPSHPVTGSGSFTAAQATAANLNATVVGSGSFTAAQSTASNLKAQAQLLNASGSVVDYAMTGTAGAPASDVVTIQGIVGGTTVPVSLASVPSHPVTGPLTNTELRASAVPVSLASVPSHAVTGPLTNAELRATAVPVSGTVTANNQDLTTGTGTLSGTSAVGTDILSSTDVSGFSEIMIQLTGTWPSGAFAQFQVSNDNSTFVGHAALQVGYVSPQATISALGMYKLALVGARYMRLRVTTQGTTSNYTYSYTLNPRSSFNATQPVNIVSSTALNISPSTGNGFSTHHTAISAATTNATNVKSGVPSIGSMTISNTSASIRYFKIFSLTVAPTMGTSTPVLNYAIMPNSTMTIDCGFAGLRLSSGFSYAITAGQALLDNTAVGAGDVVVNISYA